MDNEKTIIGLSGDNGQGSRIQRKKNSNGKTIAAAVASAALGGAASGAAASAAINHKAQTEENEPQEQEEAHTTEAKATEAKVTESPRTEAKPSPAPTADTEDDDVPITHVHHDPEPDHAEAYTNVNHTVTDDEQPIVPEGEQAEVQVLGVYTHVTEDNVQQTAAVLTDGSDVAVVVDVTGDGVANVMAADLNHNDQIDDGEVVDISDQDVSMDVIEQAYLEQQQQMDDLTSNASNKYTPDDYNENDNNGGISI